MEIASTKLNRSIRDNLLLADTDRVVRRGKEAKKRIAELEEKLLKYV